MKTKKMVFLGLMVGYSLVLYILETYIPNPFMVFFPGAKLGLTNIVTLIALLIFGLKETFIIVTYLSLILMYIVSKIKGFSTIGISIVGAIGHNIGQLLVASVLMENLLVITYLPFMLVTSLVTGCFVGLVVRFCYPKMQKLTSPFIKTTL